MTIKYKMYLGIGFAGETCEDTISVEKMGYTDEEWNNLSGTDKDSELEEVWKYWSNNYIDGGWEKSNRYT